MRFKVPPWTIGGTFFFGPRGVFLFRQWGENFLLFSNIFFWKWDGFSFRPFFGGPGGALLSGHGLNTGAGSLLEWISCLDPKSIVGCFGDENRRITPGIIPRIFRRGCPLAEFSFLPIDLTCGRNVKKTTQRKPSLLCYGVFFCFSGWQPRAHQVEYNADTLGAFQTAQRFVCVFADTFNTISLKCDDIHIMQFKYQRNFYTS